MTERRQIPFRDTPDRNLSAELDLPFERALLDHVVEVSLFEEAGLSVGGQ